MSPNARNHCTAAMNLICANEYGAAILNLRSALRECHNRRAWSRLMLAIRELSKVTP